MHGVYPALEMGTRVPMAYDVFSFFLEFHVQTQGVIGRAAKAVVAFHFLPGIDDMFAVHIGEDVLTDDLLPAEVGGNFPHFLVSHFRMGVLTAWVRNHASALAIMS